MIKLKNISKAYKKSRVIDNVSFDIKKNQIIGLVGENGAGKTTIMKIIAGLIKEYEGKIDKAQDLEISKLIDGPSFYKDYDARKNFRILGAYNNIPEENINDIFSLFKLDDFENKKFSQYSLGMKQRLAIAFAFLGNPDLIVLDEPLNGLDPKKTIEIINIIKKWKAKNGCSILISSHILSHLDEVCDQVLFISKGRVIEKVTMSSDDFIYAIKLQKPNALLYKYLTENKVEILEKSNMKYFKIKISSHNDIIKNITKNFDVDEIYKEKNTLDSIFRKVEGIDYENY